MLNSYKVTSIRKKSGMVIFGSPQTVVDEGDIFRIAELHVISVLGIPKCHKTLVKTLQIISISH